MFQLAIAKAALGAIVMVDPGPVGIREDPFLAEIVMTPEDPTLFLLFSDHKWVWVDSFDTFGASSNWTLNRVQRENTPPPVLAEDLMTRKAAGIAAVRPFLTEPTPIRFEVRGSVFRAIPEPSSWMVWVMLLFFRRNRWITS